MNPTDAYWLAVAIVAGILTPVLFVLFLNALGKGLEASAAALNKKAEEIKKAPPFDDVELNVNPSTNVMSARVIKNGETVWEGASSRRHEDITDASN